MECPVCYEPTARCQFKCGHVFCHSCTKTWLYKGNSSCPMCRKSLCFNGMIRLKKKWNRENCEDTFQGILEEVFRDCGENYIHVLLNCISMVQERFNYVSKRFPDLEPLDIDFILRYAWIPIEALLDHHFVEYFDIFTFERLLFVNRTKYGNLSRCRKTEQSTFKHGSLSQNHGAVGQELRKYPGRGLSRVCQYNC